MASALLLLASSLDLAAHVLFPVGVWVQQQTSGRVDFLATLGRTRYLRVSGRRLPGQVPFRQAPSVSARTPAAGATTRQGPSVPGAPTGRGGCRMYLYMHRAGRYYSNPTLLLGLGSFAPGPSLGLPSPAPCLAHSLNSLALPTPLNASPGLGALFLLLSTCQ